jgi:hypothetical protein
MGNPSIFNPFIYNDTEYMASSNLSWVKGSHSLRFGYRMERVQVNHWEDDWSFGPRGEFFFSGAITSLNGGLPPNAYNAWADWLLGQPNRMGKDTLL